MDLQIDQAAISRQRNEEPAEIFYKGCEAFWRDVKYAVMARNYQYVKDLSNALLCSRGSREALFTWLFEVKRIELEPVTEPALRNVLYHLLGYWKRQLQTQERRQLAELVERDAAEAHTVLSKRLPQLCNSYLQTSYVWNMEPWTKARFRAGGQWLQIHVRAETALQECNVDFMEAVIAKMR